MEELLQNILSELKAIRGQVAPPREILDLVEAADFLRLSKHTLRDKARMREIPFIRLGNGPNAPLRFKRSKLEAWLSRREIPTLEK